MSESRQDYESELKVMGDLVCDLQLRIDFYKKLFTPVESEPKLPPMAARGLKHIGSVLLNDILASEARLLDGPKSMGKANHSLQRLLDSDSCGIPDGDKDSIRNRIETARDKIRDYRNWRLSHNDYEITQGMKEFAGVKTADVLDTIPRDIYAVTRMLQGQPPIEEPLADWAGNNPVAWANALRQRIW